MSSTSFKSRSINVGKSSEYFAKENRVNPVFQSLSQELKAFFNYIKKRSLHSTTKDYEPTSRLFTRLFELWSNFEHRLPVQFYQEKLLEVGEFLLSQKEYELALSQCYERFLKLYGEIDLAQIVQVDQMKAIFFPEGITTKTAELTIQALMGRCIALFHVIRSRDPKLQNTKSVTECVSILNFLRILTQLVLPKESLCWLVFNGNVHIYSIARHLMTHGFSSLVLEYLLWAAISMETSIPLVTVKYLPFRTTLYTAVCQCYYDCKAEEEAEKFARRGLTKISELNQLESVSCNKDSPTSQVAFRSATIRMAVMVFKRSVFETRRKPKGILGPKMRTNYKDVINLAWPRTSSEKMLADMFDGSSAQFLAIVEALSNSNRRLLHSSAPAPDNEPEILDVFCELFMAAQEILAGGGGNLAMGNKSQLALGASIFTTMIKKGSLIELAVNGEESIPIDSVIRLIKLSYNYEHWDVFDSLFAKVLPELKELDTNDFDWDIKCLELFAAMYKVNNKVKVKKQPVVEEEEPEKAKKEPGAKGKGDNPKAKEDKQGKDKGQTTKKKEESFHQIETEVTEASSSKSPAFSGDDLISLADILLSIVNGQFQQDQVEMEVVVDAVLFLWSKCRQVFQKYQTGCVESIKYLHRMDSPRKWMYLLETVHQCLAWCGLDSVDPLLTGEVTIRLTMLHESLALQEIQHDSKSPLKGSRTTLTENGTTTIEDPVSLGRGLNLPPHVLASVKSHLLQARGVMEQGLRNISISRENELLLKDTQKTTQHSSNTVGEKEELPGSQPAIVLSNTAKDLHMEMIMTYHRVCLKLEALPAEKSAKKEKRSGNKKPPPNNELENYIESFEKLCYQCNKNYLSKALLLGQRARVLGAGKKPSDEQNKLLEDAMGCIEKGEREFSRIEAESTTVGVTVEESKVPPPPLLVRQTERFMVFKPAPFLPESGDTVAWYKIFATPATGPNAKARVGDYYFPGTGEEKSVEQCEFIVSGLDTNERYLFAVAAYTNKGDLIGGAIGKTTRPLLAASPLFPVTAYAFIAEMAYQVGHYNVAQRACAALFSYFTEKPEIATSETYITENKQLITLMLPKLKTSAVTKASPILLRQFLTSLFINTDLTVRDARLFCTQLCDQGYFHTRQTQRLRQCEKMLVAVELACWLNDSSLALQAVVQIYGLVAPMLYHKIPTIPVVQVLQRCMVVLQDVPTSLLQRRQSSITDSLNHMIACITYYLSKVLSIWGEKNLSTRLMESGRSLIVTSGNAVPEVTEKQDATGDTSVAGAGPKKGVSQQPSAHKKVSNKELLDGTVNEQLKALEAHVLSLAKAGTADTDLTGNEDPSVLFYHVSNLPSFLAFKEVAKFKRRHRFLEFLSLVARKGLKEGLASQVIEWCNDGTQWLNKRNEGIIGSRAFINKQAGGAVTVTGDDPKKFAAAMVEYSKEKDSKKGKKDEKQKAATAPPKKAKYKALRVTANMSEFSIQKQEETELKALDKLSLYLPDIYHAKTRRVRLRKVADEETQWRSQLNITLGLAHLSTVLDTFEKLSTIHGLDFTSFNRSSFLDPEWFTLDTSGAVIVGQKGGPKVTAFQSETLEDISAGDLTAKLDIDRSARVGQQQKSYGIQAAAAVTTGAPPPPLYVPPIEADDTPRTYRSTKSVTEQQDTKLPEHVELLKSILPGFEKTFSHLKRAIVLAHRGQNWSLLQNAIRELWNSAHTASLHILPGHQPETAMLTIDNIRQLLWQPLYVASDCILDMLYLLQTSMHQQPTKGKSSERFSLWVGGVGTEKGGASLKFDNVLDDTNLVDLRFVRCLVHRTLETLYLEGKWEKLVDIALRFDALSNHRYDETVLPLVVQAQRSLQERIAQAGGPSAPQPHFKALLERLGTYTIRAEDYVSSQLVLKTDKSKLADIQPGAQLDPLGHDVYFPEDAYKLSVVPLDHEFSLRSFHGTVNQAQYSSRALQHSRKLLCLYLAGKQGGGDGQGTRETTRVDFESSVGQPHPTNPPDNSRSNFTKPEEVQLAPMPGSQLHVVISSYEKTIDTLLSKGQKGLAVQAMHELGNIFYHSRNSKSACKYWSQALDAILNNPDSLHTWKKLLNDSENISAHLLELCGVWGCVMAAVLASNIAQYTLSSNIGLKTETCFLSGYLFKALFSSTLPHPSSDRQYADYEIGTGCEMSSLVPGIDFMSDHFRCDGPQTISALRWVTEELHRAGHDLFVLPLLCLSQYFTSYVCRDLKLSVGVRILKLRVLTDLQLFSEAISVLQKLLNGELLPLSFTAEFRQPENKKVSPEFSGAKNMTDVHNLKVVESLMDKRLSSSLGSLYGPHLTCQLALAHAHLLTGLASSISAIDDSEHHPQTKKSESGTKLDNDRGTRSSTDNVTEKVKEKPVIESLQFVDGNRSLSLSNIKSSILKSSSQKVSTMVAPIIANADKIGGVEFLSASELELIVQAKLEEAQISRLRHHAPLAARTVLSALKLLQSAQVLKPKKEQANTQRPSSMKGGHIKEKSRALMEDSSEPYQLENLRSRARLDARLWLKCRQELVLSLMLEIRGMGEVKEQENKVIKEVGDCRKYCAEGLGEAEVSEDLDMQAQFFFQGALLNMIEGKNVEHTSGLLEEAVKRLRSGHRLSIWSRRLLAACLVIKADLHALSVKSGSQESLELTQNTLKMYLEAQSVILNQMELLGERIERRTEPRLSHLSVPCSPIQNVYLATLEQLVHVKLRIGHAMLRNAAKLIRMKRAKNHLSLWVDCLGVLTTALELSRISTARHSSIETEILLLIGRIQRVLVCMDHFPSSVAIDTLVTAIKISYVNEHDLGLIRQAYLEIAIIYMYVSDILTVTDGIFFSSASDAALNTSEINASDDSPKKEIDLTKMERQLGWLAVRCAAATADAQRSRNLLVGDATVNSEKIGESPSGSVPEFVCLDLLGSYVIGQKPKVYKTEIEEELAPLIEAEEVKVEETNDDQIKKAMQAAEDLGWIHVLGYQTILQRLVNNSTLISNDRSSTPHPQDGSAPHNSAIESSANYDCVRYNTLLAGMWSGRLGSLHAFLASNVKNYVDQCMAPYPPRKLYEREETEGRHFPTLSIVSKSYEENKSLNEDQDQDSKIDKYTFPPGSNPDAHRPDDRVTALRSMEPEISLQWYHPPLEEAFIGVDELEEVNKRAVLLIHANLGKMSFNPGLRWVPLHIINDLHDRLAMLAQSGRIFLPEKIKKEAGAKKGARKDAETKANLDPQFESKLAKCMADINYITLGPTASIPKAKFEITRPTIENLEQLFDPCLGMTLYGTDLILWMNKLFAL